MSGPIRSALMTAKSIGGKLELGRAKEAKKRAPGQVSPSKYMPGVPRQVRAEGGKASFMQGNHPDVPDVVYHNTNKDFSVFDPTKSSSGAAFGPGIYLSEEKEGSSGWSWGEGNNVMPLHLSIKNPLNIRKTLLKHEAEALNRIGLVSAKEGNPAPLMSMERKFGSISEAAKAAGFDGLLHYGPSEKKHILVFKPEQVKSAIGNQGTFDPNNPNITKAEGGEVDDNDYRGAHSAPGPDSGTPLHDTSGVYPEDFYGHNGFRYYADLGNNYDRASYDTTRRLRGNPEAYVWVHRAIPLEVYRQAMKTESPMSSMMEAGNWVTPSKEYAKEHGEAQFGKKYKIASKRVRAREVFTNGDSIHEWGYHPDITKAEGGEVDDQDPTPDIQNPMSIFPKPQRMFPEDARPPGGQYLAMPDKRDVTGHKAEAATIGVQPGGKPFFNVSQNAVEQTGSTGRGTAMARANLFKQKAGWKWLNAPEEHASTDTIVSVEHRGKHHYALNAHFPRGVDLARYENSPTEPRLRPTTTGNVQLGPQAGSILVRGKEHPVYRHVIVKETGGLVAPQYENPVKLAKKALMAAKKTGSRS